MINFSKSEFYYDPFPHAVLKDVFDLNFYQNLCEEFPSEEKFERHDFDKKKLSRKLLTTLIPKGIFRFKKGFI